ncbi:MAG: UvrD-helicase domain-containing protein, partial [Deltaproteobacteria bacterium]|nr:UvrD-helicase domain-containing protein [Deltaproteobacteria bacterium]
LTVTGTGDFTHPGWFSEIRERLVEAEEGLFRLSGDLEREALKSVPEKCRGEVRFMLTAEISSIYKKNGKVRKIHNVVIMPSLDAAGAFSAKLARIGNVASDGRPILGLDARNLLELVLECSGDAIFIPAHIWTPWFSLFGSNSGFDSIEECFEDLTGEIFALETGLSSDPFMNRMLSALDRFTLVSNSDAHSCDKIGREANDFDCELDYSSIRNALKSGYPEKFRGTIEFFPEEGKYHLDGHRKCGARMRPGETFRLGGMCRVCGKPATVGVMNRVCRLADRKEGENVPFYRMLVPLKEVIGDTAGTGAGTKGVDEIYRKLLEAVGPEIFVLKDAPLDAVELASNPAVSRAIHKMREWDVKIEEGYDGEFGKVSILAAGERAELSGRSMFKGFESAKGEGARKRCGKIGEIPPLENPALFDRIDQSNESNRETAVKPEEILAGLNDEQRAAVLHEGAPLLIVAGPGTGKTKTLTSRIAYGIAARKMKPEECLAVTFTNKASEEMRKRLVATSSGRNSGGFNICTFHSLALRILRENSAEAGLPEDFKVIDPEGEKEFIAKLNKKYDWGLAKRGIPDLVNDFDRVKNSLDYGCMDEASSERFRIYRDELAASGAVDFGDLIIKSVELLENNGEILAGYRERFKSVYVDEYQDINPAQHRLLMALAAGCRDLMVIGDPDQSIYGFRGSSP